MNYNKGSKKEFHQENDLMPSPKMQAMEERCTVVDGEKDVCCEGMESLPLQITQPSSSNLCKGKKVWRIQSLFGQLDMKIFKF